MSKSEETVPGFGSGVKSDVTKLAGNSPDLPSSSPFHQFASLEINMHALKSVIQSSHSFSSAPGDSRLLFSDVFFIRTERVLNVYHNKYNFNHTENNIDQLFDG